MWFGKRSDNRPNPPRAANPPREIVFTVDWPSAAAGRTGSVANPRFLLTDVPCLAASDVRNLQSAARPDPRDPLILLAPDFAPDVLPLLAENNLFAVRAGDIGPERLDEILTDIGFLVQGCVLSVALGAGLPRPARNRTDGGLILPGLEWRDVRAADLGAAAEATVGERSLTLRASRPLGLNGYVAALATQFRYSQDDSDREAVARRFARFGLSPEDHAPRQTEGPIGPNAVFLPGGYASPFFINAPDRMMWDANDPRILVADFDIADAAALVAPMETALREKLLPVAIVARNLTGSALALLVVNKLRGILPVTGIRIAGPPAEGSAALRSLAQVTGSALFSTPSQLASAGVADFGKASRILSSRTWTVVVP